MVILPDDINLEQRKKIMEEQLDRLLNNYDVKKEQLKREKRKRDFDRKKRSRKVANSSRSRNRFG